MTEIPSLLVLAIALTIHLKGLRARKAGLVFAGAALLGMSVNLREAGLLFAPWLVVAPLACGWRFEKRQMAVTMLACVGFLLCSFGPFAFLFWSNTADFRWAWHGWIEASRMESARHPVSPGNLWPLLHSFFMAAPLAFVAFPIAAIREWKLRGLTPLLALALVGVFANLALIVHYSVAINWRYMLTGMPALTPLVANYFLHSQTAKLRSAQWGFASVVLGILLVAVIAGVVAWPMGREYVAHRSFAKDYRSRLAFVPHDAVMISGSQTVAVNYWRGLGAGEWDVIGSGSAWPGERLSSAISNKLAEGRRVFLDADRRLWLSDGWQQQEILDLLNIESKFRFRRVSDTIYEIRPPHDETARDQPHLSRTIMWRRR